MLVKYTYIDYLHLSARNRSIWSPLTYPFSKTSSSSARSSKSLAGFSSPIDVNKRPVSELGRMLTMML